jgi:crossover junction endodeoxyribonuclease RuvC
VLVIGIDPGLTRTGYGIVERTAGGFKIAALGVLETNTGETPARRLAELRMKLLEILGTFQPDAAAVEALFFNSNVRTAVAVGQASGVVLAAAAEQGLEVATYTPTQVKQSVVGFGAATKRQVGSMVASLLHLTTPPTPDAADACALAICYLNRSRLERAIDKKEALR